MYHCLHTAADDTMRMVEVPAVESSLDSHHSFLVHSFQPKSNATPDPNGTATCVCGHACAVVRVRD